MNLTPDILLRGYSIGIFPMADRRDDDEIFWVDPRRRGIMPLNGFHISRSLARQLRREPFQITHDVDFSGVVDGCADRTETWINDEIHRHYLQLHKDGHAHSLEVWDGPELVGGVYGVVLGAAFFGESMFSRRTGASKIALSFLVDRLKLAGFTLLDTQFLTEHLASLGGIEISRSDYRQRLEKAIKVSANFAAPPLASAQEVIQRNTQTS
jgi:leucyl/phenylalanyl-tRNA---protein transferase